jgi:hypothetical protein
MVRLSRYVWASPVSAAGLITVPMVLATGGRVEVVQGVVEVSGGVLGWLLPRLYPRPAGVSALTLGHVVLARDAKCQTECRAHERVHVRQCEQWGPLFPLAYLSASAVAWLAGGDWYCDNVFEREAYAACRLGGPSPRGRR